MTRVCLVGTEDVDLRAELVSRETAREALATYDLQQPYRNTVAVETISLGAAVALCNDLNWYLVRFAADALVREPSVSDSEWLSRELAAAVRDGEIDAEETDEYLKVYGLTEDGELVEPMYLTRRDGEIPDYDLREVADTVVVRVAESEFGG
ncbi:DUF5804 family protein [Halorussus litoreus]|uniref:DUF5804 family protein n=1 Tax=Halorussus litoreus TaxID=1710536 RepID=UPI000E23423C|nr:DUF5804 family protein [Halorussus litoreus]